MVNAGRGRRGDPVVVLQAARRPRRRLLDAAGGPGRTPRRKVSAKICPRRPFADTKEHLVGFYVIEVPDLDSALTWAARVPNARTGTIEVRPLQEDAATVLAPGRAPGSA